ncbi:hypothetical protein ACWKW6_08900 [Dyadobacter jiangsuensis]
MFYPFKPNKFTAPSREQTDNKNGRFHEIRSRLRRTLWAAINRHPNLPHLLFIVLLGIVGSLIAGTLFYQGLSQRGPTVFKFNLGERLFSDRILIPEGLSKQQNLDEYLDSLDKAITADSIKNLQLPKLNDYANDEL